VRRAATLTIAVPFAAAVAAGCTPRLDRHKLESEIQSDMEAKGVPLSGLTCPEVMLSAGKTFECTAADSNGTHAVFDVTATGDRKGSVSWKMRGKFENMAVVGDRLEQSLSASQKQPVDVVCPSKNFVIQTGVTFECDAKVGARTKRFVFTAGSDQGDWSSKVLTD
jgi:hypothetical protein